MFLNEFSHSVSAKFKEIHQKGRDNKFSKNIGFENVREKLNAKEAPKFPVLGSFD